MQPPYITMSVSYNDISEASQRISKFIHKTPVSTCSTIDHMVGRNVHFKCENFQKTGSFKARGALNAVSMSIHDAKCVCRTIYTIHNVVHHIYCKLMPNSVIYKGMHIIIFMLCYEHIIIIMYPHKHTKRWVLWQIVPPVSIWTTVCIKHMRVQSAMPLYYMYTVIKYDSQCKDYNDL